jgi:negative regulator of flagellin synthesis FlgM
VSSSINGFGTQAVRIAGGKAVSRAADGSDTAPSADPAPSDAPSDSVSISSAARSMATLEAAVSQSPTVDSASVAAVQQRIEDGTYKPDPQRIADKLIRMERELPGRQGRQ